MIRVWKPFRMLAFLVAVSLIVSCSDDEKQINRLIVNGTKYPLSHGYIRYQGTDTDTDGTEGGLFEVAFTTKKLLIGEVGNMSGSGHTVRFNLFSEDLESLADGTYIYELEGFLVNGLNFAGGAMGYAQGGSSDYELYITAGSVTVNKSGSNYKITWNLQMFTDGKEGGDEIYPVSGRYQGSLTEFFYGGR